MVIILPAKLLIMNEVSLTGTEFLLIIYDSGWQHRIASLKHGFRTNLTKSRFINKMFMSTDNF